MIGRVIFALFIVIGLAAYWYFLEGLLWLFQNHPWHAIGLIVLTGLPLGYFVTRYSSREAQKRSLWSSLQDVSRRYELTIPARPIEEQDHGALNIDGLPFRGVSFQVTAEGIRLERRFANDRAVSISWAAIQRIDEFQLPQKKTSPIPCAAIQLKDYAKKIVVLPWLPSYRVLIPETIGQSDFKVIRA